MWGDKTKQELESDSYMNKLAIDFQRDHLRSFSDRIHDLEKQVVELTKALEWHVGTTLEILLSERNLTKLKIAEHKQLIEETGSTELVNTLEGREQDGGDRTEVGRA